MITDIISGALKLGSELIEDKDKKTEYAFKTMDAMLTSKTYRLVDATVKLAYASEQITKGLIRPIFSAGLFIWGVLNPDDLAKLHELGTVGDMGIAAVFGAAPGWMVSRHAEKKVKAEKSKIDWDEIGD